ncbi:MULTISPECIES: NUDIX hydrolase [Haloarcula]|uniref:NUDIX hydrolase n=1 Tax=Haloarcula TaxID=2237 RepID=UPI0023ED951B|nr:NUDIX domain-containing protein [Halomicroarcula sp. XH51]
MTLEARTREAVRAELERLVDVYGDVPVERETATNEPDLFSGGRELAEEGWLGEAGAWVENDAGEVLLIRHEGAPDTWGTPGGAHDPGENLGDTARRAVRETTGVECDLTSIYFARWKTVVEAADDAERLHMLTVEFEAAATSEDVTAGADGVLEARWFGTLPDRLHEVPARKVADEGE